MSSTLGPIAAQRARNAQMMEQAVRTAGADNQKGANKQKSANNLKGANDLKSANDGAGAPSSLSFPVVLLPANTRELVPLPAASRATFLAHLHIIAARAFAQPLASDASDDGADARDDVDAQLSEQVNAGVAMSHDAGLPAGMVEGGCGTCRGACCTAGGTHAFLKEESLLRVRRQLLSAVDTPEALVAHYEAALPAMHYDGSCVFHDRMGCTLARGMRSSLCNRYQCGGLTQLSRALSAAGATSAYIAAGDRTQLVRMALATPNGTHDIAIV